MDAVANNMIAHLPVYAHNMVTSGDWKGGDIVKLDSALSRASSSEVAMNYHLLLPVLQHMPDRVPRLKNKWGVGFLKKLFLLNPSMHNSMA